MKTRREVKCVGLEFMLHGVGRSRMISRSNKINRIATKKNWMEIGERASPCGSNPHSYGDSLLISGFCGIDELIIYRRVDVAMAVMIRM